MMVLLTERAGAARKAAKALQETTGRGAAAWRARERYVADVGRPMRNTRPPPALFSAHLRPCGLDDRATRPAPRRLQREQEPEAAFVFTSERGSPFTTAGFARLVERWRGCEACPTPCGTPAASLWLTRARHASSASVSW